MGDAEITASQWRLVEVGRVVLFSSGEFKGRLAAIVEIVDHKRVLVEGPSSSEDKAVPRHTARLSNVSLAPIVVSKLPRGAGFGALKSRWDSDEVEKKWESSAWAQSRAKFDKRRQLNDFERFKVMKLRKQARFEVRKNFAKIKASAKS